MRSKTKAIRRCTWVHENEPLEIAYHDEEWGVPVYDDRHLFEMLILEGAQAGLTWLTILKRRRTYRKAFHSFDLKKVSKMQKRDVEKLMKDPGIIRNRAKIQSTISNAIAFQKIQKEFGSFSDYLWGYVDFKPIRNKWASLSEIPPQTPLSQRLSKDLKKRGFRFVGPTIMYAFMQAVGLVEDHLMSCSFRGK